METLFELIFLILFEYLLCTPGAFVRWLYLKAIGKPKSFKKIIKDNPILNGVISAILIGIAFIFLMALINE